MAVVSTGKLAATDDGGWRYTCPSWELSCDGRTVSVPGFQPLAAYEVAIANLAPGLERRENPEAVAEVLRWAGEPLATAEVAAVCGYADQAHLSREFKRYSGATPSAFARKAKKEKLALGEDFIGFTG